jgi:hypothetical protein
VNLWLSTIFIAISACIYSNEKNDPSLLEELISQECYKITEINKQPYGFSEVILPSLYEKNESSKYLSISVNDPENNYLENLYSDAKKHKIDFSFWKINESYVEIEPTDLLILNSLETYHNVNFALNTFSKNVRKYIYIPHMYKNGLQFERESDYTGDYLEYPNPNPKRSNRKGVWLAITDFLDSHPEWTIINNSNTNDALVLFRTSNNSLREEFSLNPNVDYYLNNKIILCTGPSLGRYEMLKDNLESELRQIPYKKIFVRTNDSRILDIKFPGRKVDCKRIPNIEKYVDCWNCIISSLKDAVNDPEVCDDDIILFKHESVFLNDLGLFKRAINKLLSGSNMIVRTYFGGSTSDIFLIKVSAIKRLIQYYSILNNIPEDQYVEMMLHGKIVRRIPNVYCIHLGTAPFNSQNISTWGSNGLGFYHYHRYFKYSRALNEFTDPFKQKFWKKENYSSVFDGDHKINEHLYYNSLKKLLSDHSKMNLN